MKLVIHPAVEPERLDAIRAATLGAKHNHGYSTVDELKRLTG